MATLPNYIPLIDEDGSFLDPMVKAQLSATIGTAVAADPSVAKKALTAAVPDVDAAAVRPALPRVIQPILVICDDDGYATGVSVVKPILDAKGIKGSFAITTNLIGQSGRLTWDQVRALEADGHDILNHTASHADLNTDDATILHNEIVVPFAKLVTERVYPKGFVFPYSVASAAARKLVRSVHRFGLGGIAGGGRLTPPVFTYGLTRTILNDASTLVEMQANIDAAIANNRVLVLFMHSGTGLGTAGQAVLTGAIDYAKTKGIAIVTASQALEMVGNLTDIGDYAGGVSYYVQGPDGKVVSSPDLDPNRIVTVPVNTITSAMLPGDFAAGKRTVSSVSAAANVGWPAPGIGKIEIDRLESAGIGYATQTFTTLSGRVYSRFSDGTGGSWSVFSYPSSFVATGQNLASNYDAFEVGTTIIGAVSGGPGGVNGTLVNIRPQANASNPHLYSQQWFYDIGGTGLVWWRKSTGTTSWSTWSLMTRALTGTAAPTTTPPAVDAVFRDTVARKLYWAFGTASAADWVLLN